MALVAEIRSALPALEYAAKAPAGDDGVMRVVGRRQALYPMSDMSEGALAAFWDDYCDALGDLPEAVLEAAMKDWIKRPDSRFMPKPGELRDIARGLRCKEIVAYQRATGLLYQAARNDRPPSTGPADPPFVPPTPEERAKIVAETRALFGIRPKTIPTSPADEAIGSKTA